MELAVSRWRDRWSNAGPRAVPTRSSNTNDGRARMRRMISELLLLSQGQDRRPVVLSVEPAGSLHDGIQAAVVDGRQDPLIGSILLLPGTNQQVAERARGQVRLLGQEENRVQGRTDDTPFSVRPDSGRRRNRATRAASFGPVTSTRVPRRIDTETSARSGPSSRNGRSVSRS